METNTHHEIICPCCGGELFLHTHCPTPFYFCTACDFEIEAGKVRNAPVDLELISINSPR